MAKVLMSLKIEVNDKELQKYLRQAIRRMGDIRPALKQCGVVMIRSFGDNFRHEGRPNKWKPLAKNTVKLRRKGSDRILQDTGMLRMSSMSRTHPGNIYRLRRQDLKMGSNLVIAAWQQYGTPAHTIAARSTPQLKIPLPGEPIYATKVRHPGIEPRPFILIQKKDIKDMTKIFRKFAVGT
jgi:phage gpG-like protein